MIVNVIIELNLFANQFHITKKLKQIIFISLHLTRLKHQIIESYFQQMNLILFTLKTQKIMHKEKLTYQNY